MSIWYHKDVQLQQLNAIGKNTMGDHLGMEWVAIGADYLQLRMPVDERTKQPYGLLHGGASCALAETVGSVASQLVINPDKFICVGLEINANHIRSATSGFVTATCKPIHTGASTHVWDIQITDDNNRLICVSRLTVAVLKKKV
jgi:1,4-dihydroxy-2-naphthoyl-CoA hydrolase